MICLSTALTYQAVSSPAGLLNQVVKILTAYLWGWFLGSGIPGHLACGGFLSTLPRCHWISVRPSHIMIAFHVRLTSQLEGQLAHYANNCTFLHQSANN